MAKSDLDQKLDRLLDVIAETILGAKRKKEAAAVPLWPIPTPQGMLYWGKEWSKKLYHVLNSIDKQKISAGKMRKAVKFPSRIAHILWRIDAIKNSELTKKEKLYIVGRLFDYLTIFRKGNLWCEGGKNVVWDLEELEDNKKNLFFFSAEDKETRRLLFNLEASLMLYTELLYWANHPLGHSFHGLYDDGEDMMLVREYFDLRPEVWDFSKNLSFPQVEIFEVYKKGTKIKLDFFERGIRTTEPFKQNLLSFAMKVDRKLVNQLGRVSRFFDNLNDVVKEGSEFIQSLSEQQLIEKHAEYWFHALKPLCDLVDEDWHPQQSVRDNIYKRYDRIKDVWENVVKKSFGRTASLSLEQQAQMLRENFDPRI